MSFFGVENYEPQWLNGASAISAAHGQRLAALTGRHLRHTWLLRDLDADEWWADAPVLLDFDGEQVEINHQKFNDLSITWNTVHPTSHTTRACGALAGSDSLPRLGWRHDAVPELTAVESQQLVDVELLEYVTDDLAKGMVALCFTLPGKQLTVSNGLDENCLDFGRPAPATPACWRSVRWNSEPSK